MRNYRADLEDVEWPAFSKEGGVIFLGILLLFPRNFFVLQFSQVWGEVWHVTEFKDAPLTTFISKWSLKEFAFISGVVHILRHTF